MVSRSQVLMQMVVLMVALVVRRQHLMVVVGVHGRLLLLVNSQSVLVLRLQLLQGTVAVGLCRGGLRCGRLLLGREKMRRLGGMAVERRKLVEVRLGVVLLELGQGLLLGGDGRGLRLLLGALLLLKQGLVLLLLGGGCIGG